MPTKKFEIVFTDLSRKGFVEASADSIKITDSKGHQESHPAIIYTIKFPNETIVLFRLLSSKEWFPAGLNPHVPDYITKRTMIEIEKFENENV